MEQELSRYDISKVVAYYDLAIDKVLFPTLATAKGKQGYGLYAKLGDISVETMSGGDQSIMFMITENVIYYPSEDAILSRFFVYFEIPSLQGVEEMAVKSYTIDFDGVIVGIEKVENDNVQYPEGWYTIMGIKLPQAPTLDGIYIHNGKKVFIKK